MRGARLVRSQVRNFLAAEMPAHLAALRVEWGLDAEALPDFRKYSRAPLQALDQWPCMAVTAVRSPSTRRREHLRDAGIEYVRRWQVRVFVWVNTDGWDEVHDMRDDLTAATTRLFLAHPTIGVAGEKSLLEENTITEEYADVTPVKGDRFVSGAFVGFDLSTVEVLSRATMGTVLSTHVTGLPAHPALD